MIVVSDTGVILSLSAIQKIHLLFDLFDQVLIPEAVWLELIQHKNFLNSNDDLKIFEGCIRKIIQANNLDKIIDAGESESIIKKTRPNC